MPVDLAERKRRAIRGELSEVALGLLTDRTFESLTIDETPQPGRVTANVLPLLHLKGRRVFAFLDQWAMRLAADIVARPADEDPVMAVQISFRQLTAATRSSARAGEACPGDSLAPATRTINRDTCACGGQRVATPGSGRGARYAPSDPRYDRVRSP